MMAEASAIRLAAWLLAQFLAPASAAALAGDLAEKHHRGRSVWWIWKQALGAIVVAGWEDLRAHPVLAVRAGAVACVTYVAVAYLSIRLFGGRSFTVWSFYGLVGSWYFVASFVAAWSHRRMAAGIALALLLLLLGWTLPDLFQVIRNGLENSRYLPYVMDRILYLAVAICTGAIGLLMAAACRRAPLEPSVSE